MPTGSVPCRACGRPVPAGALACPSCSTPVMVPAEPVAAVESGEDALTDAQPTLEPDEPLHAPAAAPGAAAPPVAAAASVEAAPPLAAVASVEAAPPLASDPITTGGVVPGSYLPPSTVYRPVAHMITAPAPGKWAPSASPVPTAVAPESPVGATARGGRASLLADLPFDAPDSLAEWLVAAGSAAAALSFLLPWAPGTYSYVTSWGLSSAGRLPILALLVISAALAILPNRVATWVRLGVLGLLGGGLYLGLLWPFVFGDFGADFGAVIGAAAAIVLIVGGIVGVAPRRERPNPD